MRKEKLFQLPNTREEHALHEIEDRVLHIKLIQILDLSVTLYSTALQNFGTDANTCTLLPQEVQVLSATEEVSLKFNITLIHVVLNSYVRLMVYTLATVDSRIQQVTGQDVTPAYGQGRIWADTTARHTQG